MQNNLTDSSGTAVGLRQRQKLNKSKILHIHELKYLGST
jgi:hypothetical protein